MIGAAIKQTLASIAVESKDVAQHAEEPGPEQVGTLRKEGVEVGAGVFDAPRIDTGGKRHVCLAGVYAKQGKESGEVRVVAAVEHHKPGVDGEWPRGVVYLDGI